MTVAGWIEIALFLRGAHRADAADRRLHGARVHRRGRLPRLRRAPGLPRCSACGASAGRTGRPTRRSVLVFSVLGFGLLYLVLRTQTLHPFNPQDLSSPHLGPVVQHRRVVRVEHELAVLRRRDDAVVLLADGRPGGAELRLRRRRHRRAGGLHPRAGLALRAGARQLLRRPHPRAALHPAAAVGRSAACSWSPRACSRTSARSTTCTRSPGSSRRSCQGPSPRRRRSSCSAPTAAASSTSTRRCRSRTRRGSRTSSRC